VTQGGLVSSKGKVWSEYCGTRRRKGEPTAKANPDLKPPAVGADISASEIPADAVPGVGSRHGTLERSQSKRLRIAAWSSGASVLKRGVGGGRPRTLLRSRRVAIG